MLPYAKKFAKSKAVLPVNSGPGPGQAWESRRKDWIPAFSGMAEYANFAGASKAIVRK